MKIISLVYESNLIAFDQFVKQILKIISFNRNIKIDALIEYIVITMNIEDLLGRRDISEEVKDLLKKVLESQKKQDKREEALLKEKVLTDKTIDSLKDTYFIFNIENGQPLKWNKAFREISGYTDEEIKSMIPADFYQEEDLQNIMKATEEVINKGYGWLKASLVTKHSKKIPYETIGVHLKEYREGSDCICAIGRDLTERRLTEQALQESQDKLSWLAEASHDYLMTLDLDLNVQFINRTESGLTKDDILGKPLFLFVDEQDQSYVREHLTKAIVEKKPTYYYTEYLRPDKTLIHYESVASPIIRDNRVIGLTVSSRDVTKRKEIERKLENRSHDLEERIKELTVLYEFSRFSVEPNKTLTEIIHKCIELIPNSYQYPEITCVRINYEENSYRSTIFHETPWVQATPIEVLGKSVGLIEVYYMEEKPIKHEGPFLKEERELIDTFSRELGKFAERKIAEKREEFLHTVLRHDLGNKLHVIDGYLSLTKNLNISEKEREFINIAINACKEGQALISKIDTLKDMDKAQLEETVVLELIPVIESVLDEFTNQALKQGIEIKFEKLKYSKFKILAGPLLREVFSNIIDNCLTHSKGTRIDIIVHEKKGNIDVIIEDDGEGVPKNLINKIFLRGIKVETSKGSGLGLYLVKTIIEAYGGTVTVENIPQGGARFKLTLKKAKN